MRPMAPLQRSVSLPAGVSAEEPLRAQRPLESVRRLVLRVVYWPAAPTNSKVRVLLMSICILTSPPFGAGLDIVIGCVSAVVTCWTRPLAMSKNNSLSPGNSPVRHHESAPAPVAEPTGRPGSRVSPTAGPARHHLWSRPLQGSTFWRSSIRPQHRHGCA